MGRLLYVEMKTSRAQKHFDALQADIDDWLSHPKHYTVTEETKFESALHIIKIEIGPVWDTIPMLLSEFVHCLRSSLDNLAWELAHLRLPPLDRFTNGIGHFAEKQEKIIQFPIFRDDNSTYADRRRLFPSAVAEIFDTLQPHLRGDAYRDDPLWQLNELWTMDKHRGIPMNSNALQLSSPGTEWQRFVHYLQYHVEVRFPILLFFTSEVEFKPTVTVEVLFGEYMGEFSVTREGLSEINNFVRTNVIPRFTGFFAQ